MFRIWQFIGQACIKLECNYCDEDIGLVLNGTSGPDGIYNIVRVGLQ